MRTHPHHRGRVLVLHALFMIDVGGARLEEALGNVRQEATEAEALNFVEGLTRGVCAHLEELDAKIRQLLENWSWERVARVDRNLLRMGAYELLHCPDIAPAIVIDEAVELAKVYCDERSPGFINGVLDAVLKKPTRSLEELAAEAWESRPEPDEVVEMAPEPEPEPQPVAQPEPTPAEPPPKRLRISLKQQEEQP